MKINRSFIFLLALMILLPSCGRKQAQDSLDVYQIDLSAEQLLRQVKRDGFVVMEDGDVSVGQEIWRDFFEKTQAGEGASVKLATYYTLDNVNVSEEYYEENKDKYPVIYLAELSYNGREYTYRSLNGLDGQNGFICTYSHLLRFEDVPKSPTATYTVCERYVLVHDADVTYDRLQYGLYSSQMGDYIAHTEVYSDYQYKPEYQEREKSK